MDVPECSNLGWGAFNHLFSGRGDDDTDVTDCADLFGVRVVKTFGTNDMVAKPASVTNPPSLRSPPSVQIDEKKEQRVLSGEG